MSSKKILIAVIAMVVLLGAAIAGYAAVDHAKKQEENASSAEAASLNLFSFDDSMIDTVTIDNDEGHFKVTAQAGQWTLAETDYQYDFTLNTYYITSVVSYMSNLTALEKFDIAPEQRSAYGLDQPTVVTCSQGGTDYTLYVGNASATEEYWYVMANDTVFGIDYSQGEVLRGGTQYLKTRYILSYLDANVTAVRLDREKTNVVDLVKEDGLWTMKQPQTRAMVNSATVGSMVTSLVRREVSSFETVATDSKTLAEYGLDKPAYTLTVSAGDDTTVLLFAPTKGTGNGMYVLDQASGQISVMDEGSTGFLQLRPEELLSKKLIELTFTDARSLDVQVDDITFRMEMDAAAGMYKFDGKDLSGSSENIRSLFRNLYDTVGNLEWESMALEEQLPEAYVPDCIFCFTDADGKETELTLVRTADENLYWACLDGEYTGMLVRRRSLTGTTGVLNFYEKMTDALAAE